MFLQGRISSKSMMQIVYFSNFQKNYYIRPIFAKLINVSPIFIQFTFFYLIYDFFLPYFDHDVCMDHALHAVSLWVELLTQLFAAS